ncbi:bacteriocin [Lactobacillus sp. CC-MHH1034]|uniref:bacteriocin n=1 Tax=Agrilactobacillus fermenti TaxID=2586909 RepID=UPI001E374091|nr:bacteriocin [Agrilactobacillus fermenti]MCD2255760.1 bacteriocin [Agrilactobacillus fermenti]
MKIQINHNQVSQKLGAMSQFEILNTNKLSQISGGQGFSAFVVGDYNTNTVGKKLAHFLSNLF